MKISIVVAALNATKTLQRCIDSINAQSYPDRELIVIDGGSTDGTVDVIKTNTRSIKYWESECDRGVYHAWNKGVAHATGEWVCFIGADDVFHNDHVIADAVPQLSGVVVYGDSLVVKKDGTPLRLLSRPWSRDRFNKGRMFPHVGAFHHRSILTGFDESFKIVGDHEFMLRALKHEEPVYLPMILCDMQIGGLSQNTKNYPTAVKETVRALKKNGYKSFTSHTLKLKVKVNILSAARLILGERGLSMAYELWRSIRA